MEKEVVSSNLGFRPRQFHCIILCLKSMQGKAKERNIISIRLETAIVYVFGELSGSICSISPNRFVSLIELSCNLTSLIGLSF